MTRFKKITSSLNLSGQGLEFGPLNRPIIAKSVGNIRYADHISNEGLKKKYENDPNVDVTNLCTVDIDLSRVELSSAIPAASLDYVVAAHVIEHVPDPASWFKSIANLLRKEGHLSLVIPDKRFCFDIRRPLTKTEDLLTAAKELRIRPTANQVVDYLELLIPVSARLAWAAPWIYHFRPRRKFNHEYRQQLTKRAESEYVDVHCWAWSPLSFLWTIRTLSLSGNLPFSVSSFHPTERNDIEFMITLKKGDPDIGAIDRFIEAERFRLGLPLLSITDEANDGGIFGKYPPGGLRKGLISFTKDRAQKLWRRLAVLNSFSKIN